MNCKDCIYIKCKMRTEKEFTKCPVDVAKEKYEESKKDTK